VWPGSGVTEVSGSPRKRSTSRGRSSAGRDTSSCTPAFPQSRSPQVQSGMRATPAGLSCFTMIARPSESAGCPDHSSARRRSAPSAASTLEVHVPAQRQHGGPWCADFARRCDRSRPLTPRPDGHAAALHIKTTLSTGPVCRARGANRRDYRLDPPADRRERPRSRHLLRLALLMSGTYSH
jgi:hypothetical protein